MLKEKGRVNEKTSKGGVGMGNNLKMLRERAGITQQEAADKIGVKQSTVAMWETKKCSPRAGLFEKIAEVYGCEIADIFAEESA